MKLVADNSNIVDDGTTGVGITSNSHVQPMDTIFVKEVRHDGPAYAAGLRQGDRILSVNDQPIIGKTYSQVIAMIQNAPADLVLNVVPKEDDILQLTYADSAYYHQQHGTPNYTGTAEHIPDPPSAVHHHFRRSSSYRPSTTIMTNSNTIEQKLRNLQLNIAHGRTQEELAQIGIFFPPSTQTTNTPQQNAFSNYIESVHRALDSTKQQQQQQQQPPPPTRVPEQRNTTSVSSTSSYYDPPRSPYHNEYVPYDYQRQTPYHLTVNQPGGGQHKESPIYLSNTSSSPAPMMMTTTTNLVRYDTLDPRQNIPLVSPSSSTTYFQTLPPTRSSQPQPQWTPHFYAPSSNVKPTQDVSDELKSPSTDTTTESLTPEQQQSEIHDEKSHSLSPTPTTVTPTEVDMKTEFVNFRKKQFETGHVENIVRDTQRESKTKKYSEKKKYENEWNRLTATADVETVMERASHFEDIDPDKFARLKSKLPSSPPSSGEMNFDDENGYYDPSTMQMIFYDGQTQPSMRMLKGVPARQSSLDLSSFSFPRVGEMSSIEFNFDPRFIMPPLRTNQTQPNPSHYGPLTSTDGQRYSVQNYPMNQNGSQSRGPVNVIRQQSYISAVRSGHQGEQPEFDKKMHARDPLLGSLDTRTPVRRRKVPPYGLTPTGSEQEMKQRRTSYLLATDQRLGGRGSYVPNDFNAPNKNTNYGYNLDDENEHKLRSTPHQAQAIKKLKNFFGEGTPQVAHALDHRPTTSQSPLSLQSSSGIHSKSGSYYDNSPSGDVSGTTSIPLTTMGDNLEPSKEGILYCKTVLKDGRRAADRSWRGAWAVLRRGALFLGKEKKHGLLIPLSCDSFPINLKNAEVELANDYVKKPRVFKVTTANQSEFLFQAPDLQSLAEWLDVVSEHCTSSETGVDTPETPMEETKQQRKSVSSLPPIAPSNHAISEQDLTSQQQRKSTPASGPKSKLSLRSPSLKRSPSLRFRKSQKSSITQPAQAVPSMTAMGTSSPPNGSSGASPRRSFVKSIVKKGLRTLKSSSSLITSQMSGQVYDESSGESLSSTSGACGISSGVNFGIDLEECESSSISRYIPIVVEILSRLVELRGITYTGIYRHAGGLTAVNWLVNELDKGAERIDFNSEKWYDVKAVASTLKTFFAKLPDSLLSSKMSSMCVEASRIDSHCDRLVELKRLLVQLDDYRFETLKYLCAHFRRVASKCDINKIDARNLAIIFGPTLIWDSKASLQSNLVDNPEKIRIIEAFILYHEWFFNHNDYNSIPMEINPQMPKLAAISIPGSGDHDPPLSNETKPSEIIQHIVRAAKRRWSSPVLLDSLSSLSTTTTDQQQTPKPINISVKRHRRRGATMVDTKTRENTCRSQSVDSSLHDHLIRRTPPSSSTDSAVHSMSDMSSSTSTTKTTTKKGSQSLRDIAHFFHHFNTRQRSKTLLPANKSRRKIDKNTFIPPTKQQQPIEEINRHLLASSPCLCNSQTDSCDPNETMYETIISPSLIDNDETSSIGFIDESPIHRLTVAEQASILKAKLLERDQVLHRFKEQIHQVDEHLLLLHQGVRSTDEEEQQPQSSSSSSNVNCHRIKRRHTFNCLIDRYRFKSRLSTLDSLFLIKEQRHSSPPCYSSLYALELL